MDTTERVVRHFQAELEQLKTRILEMGGLAEEEVRIAIKGLVERDSALIDQPRVGDLAVNIAEAAQRYIERPPFKKLIDIPRMAGIAQGMLRDALDAFVKRD